jgi:hypothetical protein
VTIVRVRGDRGASEPVGARLLASIVVAFLIAPATLTAHLLVTGALPSAFAILAVAAITIAFSALLPHQGRLGVLAVIGSAQVAGHLLLTCLSCNGTSQGCLPVLERGAEAGLQLALGHGQNVCASTPVALNESATAAAIAALMALTVLVAHTVVVVVSGWLHRR